MFTKVVGKILFLNAVLLRAAVNRNFVGSFRKIKQYN